MSNELTDRMIAEWAAEPKPDTVSGIAATDAGEVWERVIEADLWKAVNVVDREAAQRAAFALGVPDVQGERQQEILAREFARFRLALLPAKSYREGVEDAVKIAKSHVIENITEEGDYHYNSACSDIAAAIRKLGEP